MAGLSPTLEFNARTAVLTAVIYVAAAAPAVLNGSLVAGELIASAVLGVALVLLTAVDIATFRLPDILTLPLIAAGLAAAILLRLDPGLEVRVMAALAAYASIWLLGAAYQWYRGRQGIGLGDAKLFAAAGAWLGPDGLPAMLLLACLGGIAYAVGLKLIGRSPGRDGAIPFGPFLAASLWVIWLYGPVF